MLLNIFTINKEVKQQTLITKLNNLLIALSWSAAK